MAVAPIFDDNRASWLIGAPPDAPAPPLASDLDVDIAIVGGGFTGMSAAYHLGRRFPDRRIALLEATRIGNGASGRNGGLMLNGITVKDHPPELAAREYALTNSAIDDVAALIRDHALPVRFRRDGALHVCTTAQSAEESHAWVEKLARLGLPLRYVPRSELAIQSAHGAVLDPGEAVINGVDFLRAMRPVVLASGNVTIYERTQVTKIREGSTVELATASHTIKARALVLATSGYTMHLGYFTTGLLPVLSHVIATDPLPRELLAALGFDKVSGFFDDLPRLGYCSVDPEGRLAFGGGSTAAYSYRYGNATTYDARPDDDHARALRATLVRYLPQLADIPTPHRWTGPLDLTLVRHCAIGVTSEAKNIFYALGYSGHGITLANLAGRVIADLYAGNHEPWRDVAFYMRRPTGIPPEPMRWLGYHVYTKLTGRSPFKRLD